MDMKIYYNNYTWESVGEKIKRIIADSIKDKNK